MTLVYSFLSTSFILGLFLIKGLYSSNRISFIFSDFQWILLILAFIAISIIFSIYYLWSEFKKTTKESTQMLNVWTMISQSSCKFFVQQLVFSTGTTMLVIAIISSYLYHITGDFPQNLMIFSFAGAVTSNFFGGLSILLASISSLPTAVYASQEEGKKSLEISYLPGFIMAIAMAGLAGVLLWFIKKDSMFFFTVGAVAVATINRLSGGIFTKAADLSADLVGKLELGFNEDDIRNPACFADSIGDMVGDAYGTVQSILAFFLVGVNELCSSNFYRNIDFFVLVPLLAILVGKLFFSIYQRMNISFYNLAQKAWKRFLVISTIVIVLFFFIFHNQTPLLSSDIIQVTLMFILGSISVAVHFLSPKGIRSIVEASEEGESMNVLAGIVVGLKATTYVAIILSISLLYVLYSTEPGELYTYPFLLISTMILPGMLVTDLYGPIADNAGGIVEMGGGSIQARTITDIMDIQGNSTKAITKNHLAIMGLLIAISQTSIIPSSSKGMDLFFILGLIASAIVFFSAARIISVVQFCANVMMTESRKEIENYKIGKEIDYKSFVAKLSRYSFFNAGYTLSILGILSVVLFYFLGIENALCISVYSLYIGSLLGIWMSVSGGAWDNAKKALEDKKGSSSHKAAVVGDMVGDPLKDTAGTSLPIIMLCIFTLVSTIFELI